MALGGSEGLVASAPGRRLRFHRHLDMRDGERMPAALAEVELDAVVERLSACPGSQRPRVVASLSDGSIVEYGLPEARDGDACGEPRRARVLLDRLPGALRHLVCTRRNVLAVVDDGEAAGPLLVSVDTASGSRRSARLPLAYLQSIAAVDAERSEVLVVVDSRRGAYFVSFAAASDSDTLDIAAVDAEVRATAAVAMGAQWLVVARKGGELVKARTGATSGGREGADALCRRLRDVLRACGCGCRGKDAVCHCERPSRPDDDDGGRPGARPPEGRPPEGRPPGGGIADDEPCEERKRAQLGWSVASLHRAGRNVVAIASGGRRMALLDGDLNLLSEQFLGQRGAVLAFGGAASDRMLVMRRGKPWLEAWSIDAYVRDLPGATDPPPHRQRGVDPILAGPVTYRGRSRRPATPNPHLRVAVFTVTEPGQAFNDPDQSKMQAQLEPAVYDVVHDYYRENSFQALETEFDVFGVHLGSARTPLVLPRSFASYFYDAFSPGGLQAVMPGDWSNPVRFDGTEAMTVQSDPAQGIGKAYTVPFAALWTTRTHNAYPLAIAFDGTETLQVTVQDQVGATHALDLAFGALTLSHAQGDDEAAFLQALGQHVTAAIRGAEAAAGSPVVLQDAIFRRIRVSDDDAAFGRLQCQLRVSAMPGAVQKGAVAVVSPVGPAAALDALGLTGVGASSGAPGSRNGIVAFLAECLHAARVDAGEGPGSDEPHLDAAVAAVEDVLAQTVTVTIRLSENKGGAGALIALLASNGLSDSGWAGAVSLAGSESTANNENTMRYHVELADDTFTAAMDHIRATGAWDAEAVRAQFAGYDAMMIGFVGACPVTVPAADRWSSANPAGFGSKRMFVRRYEATDRHGPDPDDPVTMGTNLLIGQKFDQFAPGVMSHEVGHALGLPDLYGASGFRDDVAYVDNWCQMAGSNNRFNHFCAWSKVSLGWIAEDPGNDALNRVVQVPMPDPSATVETEAWLCPVEHWDNAMRADMEAEVGAGLPIGQAMKVHLGSDGGIVDLIELRAPGHAFSQQLPATPAVVATNVLQYDTDRRWAVNGLYRRSVHVLNDGRELRVVGDRFDFASSPEFPLKGCVAELMELRSIRGGIPIARVKVTREPAEYIDLYFQDNMPSWRSPDIWVDWPGDNADPAAPRVYPEGTPTDQGEAVRFPDSGTERHFLVVRPHNAGSVHAEDVKLRWFICDPPGAGDDGRWAERDTRTLPQVDGGTWAVQAFDWNVDASTSSHQCLRAEIIDWTIPAGIDPATGDTVALASDDVVLQNNIAQKNVFDFEALT